MSNQTDVLEKLKEKIHYELNFNWELEQKITDIVSMHFDKAITEQQALPDREQELLAEIERLKGYRLKTHGNTLNELYELWIELPACPTLKVVTNTIQEIQALQQQLDALKQKVSEHNNACLQNCAKTSGDNHCGYAGYDRDCTTCPKDRMIDGEHHE